MSATQKLLSKLSLLESDETEVDELQTNSFDSEAHLEWLTRVREKLEETLISMGMDKPNAKAKKRDGKGAYTSTLKGKEKKGGGVNKGKMSGQNYKRGPVRRESVDWLADVRATLEAELA